MILLALALAIPVVTSSTDCHSASFGGKATVVTTGCWSPWSPWWVMLNTPCYSIQVNLNKNWNIISFPINQTIDKYALTVQCENISYSWNNAVAENIIVDYIYGWNTMYYLSDYFEPGRGYWVYAYRECSIIM